MLPSWHIGVHYLLDHMQEQHEVVRKIHHTFRYPSTFFADNLFTFEKTISFLTDLAFMEPFNAAEPERQDRAIIWRKYILYWATRRAMTIPGDLVETGCYRGFTADFLTRAFDLPAAGKQFWNYDMFETPEGVLHAMPEHSASLHEKVVARFADRPYVRVVKGFLPQSLALGCPERISLLHIDLNSKDAELGVLDALFDKVSPGGAIVLDDFGWSAYYEQHAAHKAWFAEKNLMVLDLPTGQGLVIK